jgi:hypothetical protein
VHLDMLWHERDGRSPAHRWLRKNLENMSANAQKTLPQKSETADKMEKIA